MMVVPSANDAATASTRYSSIIEGARSGGTSTPRSFEARTRKVAIGSPASPRTSLSSIEAPISRSVVNSPVRSGLVMTSAEDDVGALDDQRRHDRERRRRRIGRHHDIGAVQFGLAGQRDPAAVAAFIRRDDLGAEMLQHQFGVVAAGLLLDHGGDAGRGEPRQQHRRLDLGRGHRRPVEDRHRIAGAVQRQRQAAAFPRLAGLGAHQFQRIEDPAHRPGAQRGVAVEDRRDRAAGDRPHHQPAAGTGIAEIERRGRLGEACHPDAPDLPGKRPGPLHLGAQRLHRFGGIEDVFALQQAGNAWFRRPTSAPRMRARCEIDLSPGTRTFPVRGPLARDSSGVGVVGMGQDCVLCAGGSITWATRRHAAVKCAKALLTAASQLAK